MGEGLAFAFSWPLGLALIFALVFAVRVRSGDRYDLNGESVGLRTWLALTALAAFLRTVFGVWGPMHVNGQGPMWIRGAIDPEVLVNYGPGYFELFHWMDGLPIQVDRAVFIANLLLSAIAPALTCLCARAAGVSPTAALGAGLVLALDPVSIRSAPSEAYFVPIITLVLAVAAVTASIGRAWGRGDRTAAIIGALAAALFAVTAARIHPAAYLPLTLAPLPLLLAAQPRSFLQRFALAAAVATTIAAAILLTSVATIAQGFEAGRSTGYGFGTLGPSPLVMFVTIALLILVTRWWARPALLPALAFLALGLMWATRATYARLPLWQQLYDRLFWPYVLIGVAALIPPRWQRRNTTIVFGAVGAVVLLMGIGRDVWVEPTERREYRFLSEVLTSQPPDCTLAAVSRAGRRVWDPPTYLIGGRDPRQQRGIAITSLADLDHAEAISDCVVYVRASLCSSGDGRPLCDQVEQRLHMQPIARRSFPAIASYGGLDYDAGEVEVTLARVRGFGIASATASLPVPIEGGAAITPELAKRVYDEITPLRPPDGCRISHLDTDRFHISVGLSSVAGGEHRITLTQSRVDEGQRWIVSPLESADQACPATIHAIRERLGTLAVAAPAVAEVAVAAAPAWMLLAQWLAAPLTLIAWLVASRLNSSSRASSLPAAASKQ